MTGLTYLRGCEDNIWTSCVLVTSDVDCRGELGSGIEWCGGREEDTLRWIGVQLNTQKSHHIVKNDRRTGDIAIGDNGDCSMWVT